MRDPEGDYVNTRYVIKGKRGNEATMCEWAQRLNTDQLEAVCEIGRYVYRNTTQIGSIRYGRIEKIEFENSITKLKEAILAEKTRKLEMSARRERWQVFFEQILPGRSLDAQLSEHPGARLCHKLLCEDHVPFTFANIDCFVKIDPLPSDSVRIDTSRYDAPQRPHSRSHPAPRRNYLHPYSRRVY
ncbi:MAG TPA: hypothetical protein VJJ82_05885 [Candidatus Nanoarchaeia archaeon]|nr:hypothetical protein [Candidatus Nanoarchaeia archaeon]